jgi:hypothetical protein
MSALAGTFAATAVALYVGHHVGDYWIQTDHQAKHKGEPGRAGHNACQRHVITYALTQVACLLLAAWLLDLQLSAWGTGAAMFVSVVTHYQADRREHGLMFWLIKKMPGKSAFLAYGGQHGFGGAWALDQSWHLFWGVFVAALLAVSL